MIKPVNVVKNATNVADTGNVFFALFFSTGIPAGVLSLIATRYLAHSMCLYFI